MGRGELGLVKEDHYADPQISSYRINDKIAGLDNLPTCMDVILCRAKHPGSLGAQTFRAIQVVSNLQLLNGMCSVISILCGLNKLLIEETSDPLIQMCASIAMLLGIFYLFVEIEWSHRLCRMKWTLNHKFGFLFDSYSRGSVIILSSLALFPLGTFGVCTGFLMMMNGTLCIYWRMLKPHMFKTADGLLREQVRFLEDRGKAQQFEETVDIVKMHTSSRNKNETVLGAGITSRQIVSL